MLDNEFGFSVADVHSRNYNIRVYDIRRNIFPEVSESLLNIPGRKGSWFTGLAVQHRVIQIDVNIVASSHEERLSYIESIAYWILNVNADQEIIFDDEPSKVYYGHVANSTAVTRALYSGKATIEIHCSDPYAYSTEDTSLTPDSTGLYTFDNQGSADVFPVFTTNFSADASFLSIVSPDGVVLLGKPGPIESTPVPKWEYVLNDNMQDIGLWSDAGNGALDAGRTDVGSVMQASDGMAVMSFSQGTDGAKIWHGPAVRQDLSETVQDFMVKVQLSLGSQNSGTALDGRQLGMIEVYLFDQNNAKIGKLIMADKTVNFEWNAPEVDIQNDPLLTYNLGIPKKQKIYQKEYVYYTVRKGDTLDRVAAKYHLKKADLANMNGIRADATLTVGQRLKVHSTTVAKTVWPTEVGNYNDFFGHLLLQRIGNDWYAEVYRLDTKKSYKIARKYYDTTGKYTTSKLAYVVIHFAQFDNYAFTPTMKVNNVQVIRYNTIDTSTQNPTIFHQGDELVVDFTDSSVRLNDQLMMDELDPGSEFFSIIPGTTEVKILTDDPAPTHSATFTQRYL